MYDSAPESFRNAPEFGFHPLVQLIQDLRRASKTPLIGEVLDGYLTREIEHRIDGGASWKPFPRVVWWGDAHPIIRRADAAAAPLEITVTVNADANTKDATAVFLAAFKQARAAAHRAAPPLTPSNRTRGEESWADTFRVLEMIDCRLAGEHVDNDEFAQVRALLRDRNLVLKDSRPRR